MPDRKDQIVAAAIRLFAKDGLAVPTAKVAKEAECSNGTLFNHFPTKQDLIDAVYLSIKNEIALHVLDGVDADIELETLLLHLWKSYTHWAVKNPLSQRVGTLLKMSNLITEAAAKTADELFSLIHSTLHAAISQGLVKNVPTDYLNRVFAAQLLATIMYTEENKLKGAKLNKHIHTSFRIFWDGIRA